MYIYVSNWWLGMRLVTLSNFPEWGIPCVCVCVYIIRYITGWTDNGCSAVTIGGMILGIMTNQRKNWPHSTAHESASLTARNLQMADFVCRQDPTICKCWLYYSYIIVTFSNFSIPLFKVSPLKFHAH